MHTLKIQKALSLSSDKMDASTAGDLSLSASKMGASLDASMNADLSVLPDGKGRRLSGLKDKLAAQQATVTATSAQLFSGLSLPECEKVCEDIHFEVPDLECEKVTRQVEVCKPVPSKKCEQECVCIPQNTLAVNLPKPAALNVEVSKP